MTAAELLIEIGIDPSTRGGRSLAWCIEQVHKDPTTADSIVRTLYSDAAYHFDCPWGAVERNMRTQINRAESSSRWWELLDAFEKRHRCAGLFTSNEHQTVKKLICRMAYVLNQEGAR